MDDWAAYNYQCFPDYDGGRKGGKGKGKKDRMRKSAVRTVLSGAALLALSSIYI